MEHDQDLWPNIVGQDVAKRKLGFLLEGYQATNVIPHLMFIAPKGCGKTTLAKALGRNLIGNERCAKTGAEKPKRFIEINCSTIKNVKQFVNNLMIPHIHRKECTVLFDECSELPKDVTMALLTMLNPNEDNRTQFEYEDFLLDIDFSQQTFMFATTEAHQIFHALMDRCHRIDMEDYTYDELGEIVNRQFEDDTFEEDTLSEIASVLRGNARAAQKMSGMIRSYLEIKDQSAFGKEDWSVLKYRLGINALGLSSIEIRILEHMRKKAGCSLTNIAAATGLSTQCIRQDFEMYLQKQGLMQIDTKGRSLTQAGHKYLKAYEDAEAILERAKEVAEKAKEIMVATPTKVTPLVITLDEKVAAESEMA
jgi:Holliday junction resolvasome RuvABC ATP-dependent DNA helicase subunit